jgi:hypothetical protein
LVPFRDIAVKASQAKGVGNKFRMWFSHPAYTASNAPEREVPVTRATQTKYDPLPTKRVTGYVLLHFALLTAGGAGFMHIAERDPLPAVLAPAALLVASALALTGWIEGRRWALYLDVTRQLAAVVMGAAILVPRFGVALGMAAASTIAALLAVILLLLRPASALAPVKT